MAHKWKVGHVGALCETLGVTHGTDEDSEVSCFECIATLRRIASPGDYWHADNEGRRLAQKAARNAIAADFAIYEQRRAEEAVHERERALQLAEQQAGAAFDAAVKAARDEEEKATAQAIADQQHADAEAAAKAGKGGKKHPS